uniref:CD63 antigen n=1 Tax=Otus sunia TaxID=257818 RepID=A0A8C8AEY7_9STRI
FLVEIAAAIAGYVFKDKVGMEFPPPFPWQFTCCGANNYTDWATIERFKVNNTVPRSCCRVNTTSCNVRPSPATGCLESIEAWMKKNILVVAAVALGIAFFEILGIIFACCLMKG